MQTIACLLSLLLLLGDIGAYQCCCLHVGNSMCWLFLSQWQHRLQSLLHGHNYNATAHLGQGQRFRKHWWSRSKPQQLWGDLPLQRRPGGRHLFLQLGKWCWDWSNRLCCHGKWKGLCQLHALLQWELVCRLHQPGKGKESHVWRKSHVWYYWGDVLWWCQTVIPVQEDVYERIIGVFRWIAAVDQIISIVLCLEMVMKRDKHTWQQRK